MVHGCDESVSLVRKRGQSQLAARLAARRTESHSPSTSRRRASSSGVLSSSRPQHRSMARAPIPRLRAGCRCAIYRSVLNGPSDPLPHGGALSRREIVLETSCCDIRGTDSETREPQLSESMPLISPTRRSRRHRPNDAPPHRHGPVDSEGPFGTQRQWDVMSWNGT